MEDDSRAGRSPVDPSEHPKQQPALDFGGAAGGGASVDQLPPSRLLALPPPPLPHAAAVLHDPLRILRRYLFHLEKNGEIAAEDGAAAARRQTRGCDDRQVREILRVADFLLGSACTNHPTGTGPAGAMAAPVPSSAGSSSSHLLDGALALLDACAAASGASETTPDAVAAGSESLITRVTSIPSGRSLYLVRKGSSSPPSGSSSSSRRQNRRDPSGGAGGYYLCLLPDSGDDDSDGVYYCSCRSYHERGTRSSVSSNPTCCKHLLALVLREAVGAPLGRVDAATDDEFGRVVASCLWGDEL